MLETPTKTEDQGGSIVQWRTSDFIEHFPVHTTLPSETKEQRAWILSIVECDARVGADMIGQEMYIGDFVIHPVEKHDPETGESTILRRLVLIQPDGPPISFASDGVLRSINRLVYVEGTPPPWEPPIKVVLKQRNISNGRRMFYFSRMKE